jgi:hypothetical protein
LFAYVAHTPCPINSTKIWTDEMHVPSTEKRGSLLKRSAVGHFDSKVLVNNHFIRVAARSGYAIRTCASVLCLAAVGEDRAGGAVLLLLALALGTRHARVHHASDTYTRREG